MLPTAAKGWVTSQLLCCSCGRGGGRRSFSFVLLLCCCCEFWWNEARQLRFARDPGSVLLVLDFISRPASRKTHGAMRQGIPITLRRCLSTQCLTSLATRDSQADVEAF